MLSLPRSLVFAALLAVIVSPLLHAASADAGLPALRKNGEVQQLVVDGKPFLILGGELRNSSSSSIEYMKPIWDRMTALHLNTVLAGVSWEFVEPEEGRFNFNVVDGLVRDARAHQLHLVLLWFASWKNGMSSYPPVWVKRDVHRFPRAQLRSGEIPEVLSTFAPANAEADARAFAALLKHLREFDTSHTVLMIQVENEVGILGDSRDRSPLAEAAYKGQVPPELMQHLQAHADTLFPEFKALWTAAGSKPSGTWVEVFGESQATDELFMAWNYARYVDRVAAAGKAAYPIPLYANAWLNEKDAHPGDYPSGGPLAQVLDVWKAGAPHLDLLAPDLYAANYDERCRLFTRAGNVLFIPESNRGEQGARNFYIAIGAYSAIGVSPFAIDADWDPRGEKPNVPVGNAYNLLSQVAPIILAHQAEGQVFGFALNKEHPSVTHPLGEYDVEISLDEIFGHHAEQGAGLIIATGPDEFIGVGAGFRVSFRPTTPGPANAGIGTVEEGVYRDGKWIPGRRLNGDETDQGHKWRLSSFEPSISRCVVYRND